MGLANDVSSVDYDQFFLFIGIVSAFVFVLIVFFLEKLRVLGDFDQITVMSVFSGMTVLTGLERRAVYQYEDRWLWLATLNIHYFGVILSLLSASSSMQNTLQVTIGQSSIAGIKEDNEDFLAYYISCHWY